MGKISNSGSVKVIDCNYILPGYAASYLIIEGDKAAFIECNTSLAVPRLMAALDENHVEPEQVEYIIATHVHLDHSGGAGFLAKKCGNATVLAHEKAAKHLVSPEKLMRGAAAIYGEEGLARLYGVVEPVDEKRVRIVRDRETIAFGERDFEFIYTAGHAWHHMCVYDTGSNGIFTGDAFGCGLPIFKGKYLFPTTSPIGFDYLEAVKSIDKILDTGAERAYLGHFGVWSNLETHAESLKTALAEMERIRVKARDSGLEGDDLERFCTAEVVRFFERGLAQVGFELSGKIEESLRMDIKLNAMGIAAVAGR